MVHTEPLSPRQHLPYLPDIGSASLGEMPYFHFLRPGHNEYPYGGFYHYIKSLRVDAVSPDKVIRVAVADDTDPWVDCNLTGEEAASSRWIRGHWGDRKWENLELVNGKFEKKVAEGRILGYSTWVREWPKDQEIAKTVKARCGAGSAWPADNLFKKAERALYSLATTYIRTVNPDRAASLENEALAKKEGFPQFLSYIEPVLDRCKDVGHITLTSLAVDPSFQRRGIGARLMRWGLERAETEGCPIVLIATSKGAGLYAKMGFEVYGILSLRDLRGDKVMVYWPKSFPKTVNTSQEAHQDVAGLVEKESVKTQLDVGAGVPEALTKA